MLNGLVLKRNPMRIFEKCIHGGLGVGNLGVFVARAGVGKTACIIQLALDNIFNGKCVLHISIGQTVDEVRTWYDKMLEDIFHTHNLMEIEHIREEVESSRRIISYTDRVLDTNRIAEAIKRFREQGNFQPNVVFIDGHPFDSIKRQELDKFRIMAMEDGIEIWFTARTHREGSIVNERGIPSPCDQIDDLFSVIVFLEPLEDSVRVCLLKDHDNTDLQALNLLLDSKTLLIKDNETHQC